MFCNIRLQYTADRDGKKRRRLAELQKQYVYKYPTMSRKREHQVETPEQLKIMLAAQ